jgi:hypothetical protein
LTNTDGLKVDINMENVAYIFGIKDYTLVAFVAARGDAALEVARCSQGKARRNS